ncbi:MAG TPA: hypothetical protein VJP40_06590, partial [bacterium]|nr:hypothetical protein [bacterium]
MNDKADAAGIVLKARVVKAFFLHLAADLVPIHKSLKFCTNPKKGKWVGSMPRLFWGFQEGISQKNRGKPSPFSVRSFRRGAAEGARKNAGDFLDKALIYG